MSHLKIRRAPVEAAPRPGAFLLEAIRAVKAGFPARPIELAQGVYVHAAAVVDAFAAEAEQLGVELEPQSIRADLVERVRSYTEVPR